MLDLPSRLFPLYLQTTAAFELNLDFVPPTLSRKFFQIQPSETIVSALSRQPMIMTEIAPDSLPPVDKEG